MGTAEPYGISVGHMHTASTTGWHWLPCRKRQAPGGPVDARERCVYNTSLYSRVSGPSFMVYDAHRDDPYA
jgi:hypothetical protein